MITIENLVGLLETHDEAALHIMLPGGAFVPAHFHVTEVGRVDKQFVDCGGTRRQTTSCSVQVWTANDTDHRLLAGKLAKIFRIAEPVLGSTALPVELEYGTDVAAHYFLADVEVTPRGLLLVLTGKQTECLALEKCGLGACAAPGCCD